MSESMLQFAEEWGPFALRITLTIILAIVVNWLSGRFIRRSTLVMRNDPTNYLFLRHAITALIYVLGFSYAIYSMPNLRTLANSLLAGAGILAVAVGFASQHALSNIVSGIFIVIFKPFRVNDRLRIRNTLQGAVEDITLRHTVIRDFENRRILIPNSVLSEEVIINSDFADDRICKWLELVISHRSDLDTAKRIMEEEALRHPLHIDVRKPEDLELGKPEIPVKVIDINEIGVRLRAWVWTKDTADAFTISCDLLESVKKRFDAEGVEIASLPRMIRE